MFAQGLLAALALVAATAEAAVVVQSPVASAPAPTVKAGTPIVLELDETVSTRTIKRGDTFALKLAAPVASGGFEVIPAGVAGVGQVVDVGRAGLGGKPAKLVLAARWLNLSGQKIPLRSFFVGGAGKDNTDTVMFATLAVGIAGFLVSGGEVIIPKGTLARAKLSQDFTPSAQVAAPSANSTAPSPTAPSPTAPNSTVPNSTAQ